MVVGLVLLFISGGLLCLVWGGCLCAVLVAASFACFTLVVCVCWIWVDCVWVVGVDLLLFLFVLWLISCLGLGFLTVVMLFNVLCSCVLGLFWVICLWWELCLDRLWWVCLLFGCGDGFATL